MVNFSLLEKIYRREQYHLLFRNESAMEKDNHCMPEAHMVEIPCREEK